MQYSNKQLHFIGESINKFESLYPDEFSLLTQSEKELTIIYNDQFFYIQYDKSKLYIDAKKSLDYHRRTFAKTSLKSQPLAKAIGLKNKKKSLLDATGGFLSDTLLLYSMGYQVSVCERDPVCCALISQALKSSDLSIIFYAKDSFDHLNDHQYDIIFYDPMYDQVNTKTKPKKEISFLREFVGHKEQADPKLLLTQCSRLVIKRSIKASSLINNPSMTFCGKSTCYDVYIS